MTRSTSTPARSPATAARAGSRCWARRSARSTTGGASGIRRGPRRSRRRSRGRGAPSRGERGGGRLRVLVLHEPEHDRRALADRGDRGRPAGAHALPERDLRPAQPARPAGVRVQPLVSRPETDRRAHLHATAFTAPAGERTLVLVNDHSEEDAEAWLSLPPGWRELPSACRRVGRDALAEPVAERAVVVGDEVRFAVPPMSLLAFHDESGDGASWLPRPRWGPRIRLTMPFLPASLRRALRNLSIRRKLTAIVMLTSGVAVILASALLPRLRLQHLPQQMVTDLETTAEGLGLQAYPALDAESASSGVGTQARETLAFIVGSLRAYPSVEHAVIFDANGRAAGGQERNILQERPTPPFTDRNTARLHRRGPGALPPGDDPRGPLRGGHLPPLEHARAHRPPPALPGDPRRGDPRLAPRLAAPRLAAPEGDLAADPPPRRRRDARLAREGLLGAGGQGGRRRAGRPHRRLQRHARPDPVARRRADRGQGGGGAGQPHEEHVPREHEPRAAHAAQRDHRLQRDARGGGGGARARGPRPRPRQDPGRGQAPARPHQRRARPLEDRGGEDGALPRGLRRARPRAGRGGDHPAARREEPEPARGRTAPRTSARCTPTSPGCGRSSSTS